MMCMIPTFDIEKLTSQSHPREHECSPSCNELHEHGSESCEELSTKSSFNVYFGHANMTPNIIMHVPGLLLLYMYSLRNTSECV